MAARALTMGMLAALMLTGCFPIAWVNPPATIQVGGTARAFVAEPSAPPASAAVWPAQDTSRLTLRAAIHPLGFATSLFDRDFDLSVGYGLEPALNVDVVHGPFLGVAWHAVHEQLSGRAYGRVAVGGRARLLFGDEPGAGFGLSLGASAEIVAFTSGNFASGESSGRDGALLAGTALGEVGVGVYVESGYGQLGQYAWMDVQAGAYVRLPMSAGFGVVSCCAAR